MCSDLIFPDAKSLDEAILASCSQSSSLENGLAPYRGVQEVSKVRYLRPNSAWFTLLISLLATSGAQ